VPNLSLPQVVLPPAVQQLLNELKAGGGGAMGVPQFGMPDASKIGTPDAPKIGSPSIGPARAPGDSRSAEKLLNFLMAP
jgi:hypothetical protein